MYHAGDVARFQNIRAILVLRAGIEQVESHVGGGVRLVLRAGCQLLFPRVFHSPDLF